MIAVLVAAVAAYALGAAWYMSLSRQWIAASGVAVDAAGKPVNGSPLPFILSAIAMLLVAGMMRHIFAMSGITGFGKGALSGLGIGAFIAFPWTMINYAYSGRPVALTAIDGGYAILGCTLIGAVLGLF